jgi:prepilin-type N-terminal cleavage/methylation domain-containing protein
MRALPTLKRHRGFTLLELLVVMVIIGLLAGYVGPKLFAQIGKSEVKVARAQLDALGAIPRPSTAWCRCATNRLMRPSGPAPIW